MRSLLRQCMRGFAVAAMVVAVAGIADAQQVVKIGLLATLEGPFAAGGQDGMRGAELAVKQRNGMVAGKKIEIIKASSDAKPDVAVNATRKLVEQDKVDIMVGPLSGSEGIAVKNYSKSQPNTTFINGSSGAQATTLQDPSPNFFRFNTEGAQWMVGLGEYAFKDKGYKKMALIAEDYAFPYSQVQGFMTEYCKLGGRVTHKAWVPLGGKDYSSVIAKLPGDVDALLVVLGGADAVNFLTQYEQSGGNKPMVGGSITVDQTVLNFKGKRRESLLGTPSAGPIADSYEGGEWKKFVADYKANFKDGFPSPSLFAYVYYINMKAALDGLEAVKRRPLRRPGQVSRGPQEPQAPDAHRYGDAGREPSGHRHHVRHRGGQGRGRRLLQQGREGGSERQPAAGHVQGRLRQGRARLPGRPQLPVADGAGAGGLPHPREHHGFHRPRFVSNQNGPAPIASGDALVLERVTRTFGALRAIEDVSLSVAAGERRALIGANGAGKTTLFNAVTGDFPPTAGTVRFFGEDVTTLPPHERIRMGLRRTYQSSLLCRDLTVAENLFLAVRGVARGRFAFLRAARRAPEPRRHPRSS